VKKVLRAFEWFQENIITVLLPLMCIVIFMATVFRYTKTIALPWAEEFARFTMIWIIFIGAGAAAKDGSHFGVDIVVANLPKTGKKICYIIQNILVVAFCGFVTYWAMKNIRIQYVNGQVSPAMHIPVWFMYMSVVLGCVTVAIQYVVHNIKLYKDLDAAETAEEGGNK
jgi:C4-dicarboxylate transporter DctQ subunit